MPGHLLTIAGLSGAGKTTLITAALRQLPDLRYLTTYTTRLPRESEQDSVEHIFVDEASYQKQQLDSKQWDHAEYGGAWYGTDVAATKELLAARDVICAVAPDPAIVAMLEHHYPGKQTVIWIDTPTQVAKERTMQDKQRHQRQEDDTLTSLAHHTFTPSGILETDARAFTQLLSEIITS